MNVLIFLAVLSVLVLVHEFGHFIVAKRSGVDVQRFSLGFGPVLVSYKRNGTQYALSAIPFGGYVKMAGDSREEYTGKREEYFSQPIWRRFLIIVCGPVLNYILGAVLLSAVFYAGFPALSTKVGGLVEGLGAEKAGILAGDVISAVNGKPVGSWDELQKAVQNSRKFESIEVDVSGAAGSRRVRVPLQQQEGKDLLGQTRKVSLLGIKPDMESFVNVKYPLPGAFLHGIAKTWDITVLTGRAFFYMAIGRMPVRESVTGPLGIFIITSEAAKVGAGAVIQLMALISISLGLFNLLPIPALDGGHLFLLLVEKFRGKPLSLKAEEIFNRISMVFIMSLAVLVLLNDLDRFGFIQKVFSMFKRQG